MWLARTRFRRTTELGKKAAIRAAKLAERDQAALVIQKHARRRLAIKHVRAVCALVMDPPTQNDAPAIDAVHAASAVSMDHVR